MLVLAAISFSFNFFDGETQLFGVGTAARGVRLTGWEIKYVTERVRRSSVDLMVVTVA